MKTNKVISIFAAMVMTAGIFTGCSGADSTITVISREDGSGTRGAFTERKMYPYDISA